MKYIIAILMVGYIAISFFYIVILQNQLSDCIFECNHLQTKIDRLEALGEYETALYQLMPPLGWAQIRAANEQIKQERQWEYEGGELPLLGIGG